MPYWGQRGRHAPSPSPRSRKGGVPAAPERLAFWNRSPADPRATSNDPRLVEERDERGTPPVTVAEGRHMLGELTLAIVGLRGASSLLQDRDSPCVRGPPSVLQFEISKPQVDHERVAGHGRLAGG